MRFKSITHAFAALCILSLVACSTASSDSTVTNLKKAIIATHEGLYLPAMTGLGIVLDSGHMTPALEAHIQAESEKYIMAKDDADVAIRTLGALAGARVAADLKVMADAIEELQAAKKSTGGS